MSKILIGILVSLTILIQSISIYRMNQQIKGLKRDKILLHQLYEVSEALHKNLERRSK